MSLAAISCGNNETTEETAESKAKKTIAEVEKIESIDTLSYIVGMNIGGQLKNQIIPQLKPDYYVIFNTINAVIDGKESFTVGEDTISKSNLNEIGMKYLGPSVTPKIQAAMADSTGKTEVFADPTEKEIVSTILGADIAFSLESAPFEIEKTSLLCAINDAQNDSTRIDMMSAQNYMMNYMTVVVPAENAAKSTEWLAKIEKEEEGVKKTASGIIYKIVNEGDMNVKATADSDVVKVLYTGTTRKGKVFDSNRWNDLPEQRKQMIKTYQPDQADKDNPIEFPLNGVIKGWTEGMKLVGKGGRIILWIPAELAYKEMGAGQDIGPNEALCFDVELLDVNPEAEAPAAE